MGKSVRYLKMSATEKTATERVRKSSLATSSGTVNKTGRKTSAVSFKENNTTIEYSDDQNESSDVVETIVGRKDEETLQQRKFSKFNDSLKINKRRLSRDEHGSQTGK